VVFRDVDRRQSAPLLTEAILALGENRIAGLREACEVPDEGEK